MLSMTSKSLEVENCRGIEGNICEDKISALPEDLLIHILLFLPTKDVVATMILSKRWRSIWKMVPRLVYIESKDNTNDERESVWWFLDKSLQQHKAPILERLYIELDERCPVDADVNKWIANAVDRQVRMLDLVLEWSAGPIALPTSLYTCETLVELSLCREILLDVPSSVCFTSLKNLYLLDVVYKDESSAIRFLSRCLILEELYVRRSRNDNVTNFTVEVPSLKKLFYSDDVEGNIGGSLVIDCPALKDLYISGLEGGSCSSQNMPCLDRISVISTLWDPDENFLIYVSSVTSLKLFESCNGRCFDTPVLSLFYVVIASAHLFMLMYTLQVNYCNTVYFPRLRALEIYVSVTDWIKIILLLLKISPILKHLKIRSVCTLIPLLKQCMQFCIDYHQKSTYLPPESNLSWNKLNSVPKCVSSNLEVFEWRDYRGRTDEKNFATYILANSKCLKSAQFYLSCNDLDFYLSCSDLDKTKKMREELNSMFRVSTSNLTVQI